MISRTQTCRARKKYAEYGLPEWVGDNISNLSVSFNFLALMMGEFRRAAFCGLLWKPKKRETWAPFIRLAEGVNIPSEVSLSWGLLPGPENTGPIGEHVIGAHGRIVKGSNLANLLKQPLTDPKRSSKGIFVLPHCARLQPLLRCCLPLMSISCPHWERSRSHDRSVSLCFTSAGFLVARFSPGF